MVLAIESDGTKYHAGQTTRARDRLRREHLERLGWHYYRIWSTEWFRHPDHEVARIRKAYDDAVAVADGVVPEVSDTPDIDPTSEPSVSDDSTRTPRPGVRHGLPIVDYLDRELSAMVEWIESDGQLRTDDELLREVRDELGLNHGSRIDARIAQAIETVRTDPDTSGNSSSDS
jgi:hypothetical protein